MKNRIKSIPKLIYVMGIDGSGKSTVSEYLAKKLEKKGYEVDILWLRFNHVLSKPLLGFCRLFGFTKYENCDGIRVGYHNFYSSTVISYSYIFFQYLDALRVKYIRIYPKYANSNKIIILDRYVYDILIDIAVDTRKQDLLTSWIGKKFINLLPNDSITILVDRDYTNVLEVRPEGKVDRNFEDRYKYYKTLASNPDIKVLNNNGKLDDLLSSATRIIGLE